MFSLGKINKIKGLSLEQIAKNRQQIVKKTEKLKSWKIHAQKSLQTRLWDGLGLDLGGFWGALGRLLRALGHFLSVFWAFKIELRSRIRPRWDPRGLLDRFWMNVGRFWGDFEVGLGGNLGEFGNFWSGRGQIP